MSVVSDLFDRKDEFASSSGFLRTDQCRRDVVGLQVDGQDALLPANVGNAMWQLTHAIEQRPPSRDVLRGLVETTTVDGHELRVGLRTKSSPRVYVLHQQIRLKDDDTFRDACVVGRLVPPVREFRKDFQMLAV